MLVHFYSKAHHVHNCSNDDTKGAFEFMCAKWVAVNQFCPLGQASKPLPLPLSVHIVYGWPLEDFKPFPVEGEWLSALPTLTDYFRKIVQALKKIGHRRKKMLLHNLMK